MLGNIEFTIAMYIYIGREKNLPQFFRLPRMPCTRTAVGGSGIDLSAIELHLTCTP